MSSVIEASSHADPVGERERSDLRVSVVIPCLNEAENIEACVGMARRTLADNDISGEVIVVDNGSDDGSGQLAAEAGATVVEERRRGYGSAYQAGFAAARGQYIVMGDADLTYDFGDIPRFVAALDDGADLVMGNRMDSIHPGAMPWLHRYVGNPLMTRFVNLLYRTGVRDIWCGMRGLRREILPRLDLRGLGMEFAPEMVLRAKKLGLDVRQFEIEYHPRGGESKLSTFRDGWRGLRLLLVHSPTALFIVPGAVMLGVGAVAMLLFGLDVQVFGRAWSLHSMIAAALLTIVGAQAISLGISARTFGVLYLNEPPDRMFRWGSRLGLEKGLGIGALLFLGGFGLAAAIVITWIGRGFGQLSEEKLMIAAAVLLIIGLQTIFTAFFISVLGLRREDG